MTQASQTSPLLKAGRTAIKYNAVVLLVALFIVATILSPNFLTSGNILNILRQQSTYMTIAIGMLMVLLTGGIDLSVSSTAAIGSIMVAHALHKWGMDGSWGGLWLAILIGVGCGFLIGCINGLMIAKLKMPPFIATLAMMYAGQGVAWIITDGNTILLDRSKETVSGYVAFAEKADPLLGIPYQVYIMISIVVIFFFVMHFTSFGRLVTATGSNETAVQLAGINSKKYIFWVYALCGLLCGIAGIIITARSGSASANTGGVDYNMNTIAGVVIGGASLSGGEGNVPMTVVGVFVIALIINLMNLINLPVYPQMVVKAAVIVLAVLLKSFTSKKT